MKRILIFIGLKAAEIGGIIVLCFGLRRLARFIYCNIFDYSSSMDWSDYLMCGFIIPLCALFLIAIIGAVIFIVLSSNWEWADKISRRNK